MRVVLCFIMVGALAACGPRPAPEGQATDAAAVSEPAAALALEDPWAGATPNGARAAAGYVTIINSSAVADRLIGASSPRAQATEIHMMAMENGVMTMSALDSLAAPAGEAVTLSPGGLHLMFIEIDAPFVEGQTIPVTLTFETAGPIEASFPVRKKEVDGGNQ